MLNPANLLEIAFLLLVAFLAGASAGSLARVAVLRMRRPPVIPVVAPPVPAPVSVDEAPPALVAAPVIEPIARSAPPVAPTEVPAPDFAEVVGALVAEPNGDGMAAIRMPSIAPLPALATVKARVAMAPARVAGQTTSGIEVPSPALTEGQRPVVAAFPGATAEVIPFPSERLGTFVDEASAPDIATGDAQAEKVARQPVEVRRSPEDGNLPDGAPAASIGPGDLVEQLSQETVEPDPAPAAAVDEAAETDPDPTRSPPDAVPVELDGATERDSSEDLREDEPTAVQEAAETRAGPAAGGSMAAAETVATTTPEEDEAAAMRAIEGNWTPKRAATTGSRKPVVPEGVDADGAVQAAGAAVAAAVEAVNAVVAEAPGRPMGLDGPRQGVKDNLTNIIGILPIIETALNNAGVFHFDQIAEFTDENVAWLENHLGIAGRIGREHWREQARELAIVSARARKVAAQK